MTSSPRPSTSDNDTELINKQVSTWCAIKGIEALTTALYSPLQNGVAERINRTLVELARAMLLIRSRPYETPHLREALDRATLNET